MRKQIHVLAGLFMMLALCSCEAESPTPTTHTPQPYSHDGLHYRVKVKYNVNFTYTPKEPSEAPDYVIRAFQSRLEADGNGGNGYTLAEGEVPNLILDLTVSSDNSNNKSMQVRGYVSDGNFYTCTDNTYQDPVKMIHAMADQVDSFMSQGWRGTR